MKPAKYLAADVYFMKAVFIEPLLEIGIHVVTRMRQDANIQYHQKGARRVAKVVTCYMVEKWMLKNIDNCILKIYWSQPAS